MKKPSRKTWLLWLAILGVALLSLGQGRPAPPVIETGTDCWHTEKGTEQRLKTLPANYFGEGSKAIPNPVVQFEGVPLEPEYVAADYPGGCGCPEEVDATVTWLNVHGDPTRNMRHAVTQVVDLSTDVDTCVRRSEDARFGGRGGAVKVDIELVALSLRSVEPLEVAYKDGASKLFDVFVTASKSQKPGSMTFTSGAIDAHGKTRGKVKLDSLPVYYDVEYVERGGPMKKSETGLRLVLQGTDGEFALM